MTARNDITGDAIKTKGFSKAFEDNFDRIFRSKKPEPPAEWNEERIDIVGQNGNDGLHYDTQEQS